jgi:23S rRNA (uracil1939-C5)-methyltransferase
METITINAERPAYGGITIGRSGGKVVMITGAIPGETVEARIDLEKKDYSTATVLRVLEPSPDRVVPGCPYFGSCGGCHLQHIEYARQVSLKQEVLADCIRRMAGLEPDFQPPLNGPPWGYRRRAQFKVSRGKAGLYRGKTRDVIDMDSCPVMAPEVNAMLAKARGLVRGLDVRELHISCGDGPVALVKTGEGPKSAWDRLAGSMLALGFAGVFVETGRKRVLKYGRGFTTFELGGLSYTVSPMSFFQGNWGVNRELVRAVIEGLGPPDGKTVLDLYSGAGNFSLPIALKAGKVTAVEENPYAVEDGRRNAGLSGIKNCTFVRSGVDSLKSSGAVDVLIIDPPRTGLANKAADIILSAAPSRIVYVSCNPASFARDLKKLSELYDVESVRLVDFFPQTYHIESVAFLRPRIR